MGSIYVSFWLMALKSAAIPRWPILKKRGCYRLLIKGQEEPVDCTYLIGAPGRAGAEWFSKECEQLGLDLTNNQVDVGVRVEVPAQVFEDITNESMKPNSYIQPSSMVTGSALSA